MTFDGQPRVPLTWRNDTVALYRRAERSASVTLPQRQTEQSQGVRAAGHATEQETQDGRPQHPPPQPPNPLDLTEEQPREQLAQLAAQLLGMKALQWQDGHAYQFGWNPSTYQVELRDTTSGQVVLTLSPEQVKQLASQLNRPTGWLTNRTG